METTKGMTSEQRKALKALIESLSDHYPGIASVEISYDGYNEEAKAKTNTYYDRDGNEADIQDERFGDLIDDLFNVVAPEGFEIGYGSCGNIVVDISTWIVHLAHISMEYKKWSMEYMAFKGVEPKWYVMTSERSNAFVFMGTSEKCKKWIDEKVESDNELFGLQPLSGVEDR